LSIYPISVSQEETYPSSSPSREPENGVAARRLLTAIIRRAVLDFALYRDCDPDKESLRHELAADAAGWLFFDGTESIDAEGRYTFLHICSLLGINAQLIREQALMLTRKDLQRFNGDAGST